MKFPKKQKAKFTLLRILLLFGTGKAKLKRKRTRETYKCALILGVTPNHKVIITLFKVKDFKVVISRKKKSPKWYTGGFAQTILKVFPYTRL